MTTHAQHHLQRERCRRCGRPAPPSLEQLAAKATRAHVAIRDRRLAVPSAAMADLQEVAAALRCHASLCSPKEVA